LTKSAKGSCVISTKCQGLDTSQTEFAFDCVKSHAAIKRHLYGIGGFEANEEFDSEVKCDTCAVSTSHLPQFVLPGGQPQAQPAASPVQQPEFGVASPPSSTADSLQHDLPTRKRHGKHKETAAVILKSSKVERKHEPLFRRLKKHHHLKYSIGAKHPVDAVVGFHARLRAKHHHNAASEHRKFWPFTSAKQEKKEKSKKAKAKPKAVKYGPKDCVSTYKNGKGECVMQTKCAGVNIKDFEFGLLCVDKEGIPVHHNFGKGSFGTHEKFDTLIACDKCLAPKKEKKEVPAPKSPLSEAKALSAGIKDLTKMVTDISNSVQKLNSVVFKRRQAAPAPAPAPGPAAAEEDEEDVEPAKASLLSRRTAMTKQAEADDDDDSEEGDSEEAYKDDDEDEEQVAKKQEAAKKEEEDEGNELNSDGEEDTDSDFVRDDRKAQDSEKNHLAPPVLQSTKEFDGDFVKDENSMSFHQKPADTDANFVKDDRNVQESSSKKVSPVLQDTKDFDRDYVKDENSDEGSDEDDDADEDDR